MRRTLRATFDTKASTGYFICALLATAVVWIGIYADQHWWGPRPDSAPGFTTLQAWRFKLFAEGPIPYGILWAFAFGVLYLGQIWAVKFVPLGVSNTTDAAVIAAVNGQDDDDLVKALNAQVEQGVTGYYGHRLRTMRLRYSQDQDLSAVQAMKDDVLTNDEEDIVLSFNAVSWAEWALPMLGFLGTVVGIGEALGGIQKGVQTLFGAAGQQAGLNAIVLRSFNEGFSGLAVAFDTTFLGLIFLLVLGLLKVSLKKMLAKRLADARKIFFEAVSMWRSGDSNQPMVVAMAGLNLRMEALEAIVEEADQRSTAFREGTQAMALAVIRANPDLKKFKDVLFNPVVQFRKAGKDLEDRVSELLKRETGGATVKVVSIVPSLVNPQTIALCAVVQGTPNPRCMLLRLTMRGEKQSGKIKDTTGVEALLAFQAPDRVLARNSKGEVLVIPATASATTVAGDCKEDIFHPVLHGKQSEAVVWIRTSGGNSKIQLLGIDPPSAQPVAEALPQDFDWRQWGVHAHSATCFAAGKRKGAADWKLWIHSLTDRRENAPGPTEQLLAGIEPVQLIALAKDQVVILDSHGRLHYWQASFASPVPLTHTDWAEDAKCVLRAGTRGWFSVASKDHLQMWQVGRGGRLHLYDANGMPKFGLEISGVKDPREFVVSGDGRLLLAVDKGGGVIGWEFPVLTADTF